MKVFIDFNCTENASGGGNKFIGLLKKELLRLNYITDDFREAKLIMYNSHHSNINKLKYYKKINRDVKFVHRVDGPIYFVRGNKKLSTDKYVKQLNLLADLTIFQTNWSKSKNLNLGIGYNSLNKVIINGSNSQGYEKAKYTKNYYTICISTWSDNINKGFYFWDYLDNFTLNNRNDIKVYFWGNSKFSFKNIINLGVTSNILKEEIFLSSDFYLNSSINEPCSNAIIEALVNRIPVIYYDDGGNSEIVSDNGVGYRTKEELTLVLNNLDRHKYLRQFDSERYDIKNVACSYIEGFNDCISGSQCKVYNSSFIVKEWTFKEISERYSIRKLYLNTLHKQFLIKKILHRIMFYVFLFIRPVFIRTFIKKEIRSYFNCRLHLDDKILKEYVCKSWDFANNEIKCTNIKLLSSFNFYVTDSIFKLFEKTNNI